MTDNGQKSRSKRWKQHPCNHKWRRWRALFIVLYYESEHGNWITFYAVYFLLFVIKLCRSSNMSTVQGTGLFVTANAIITTYFMAIIWKKRGNMCISLNVFYSRKTRDLIIRCLYCTPPANNPATLQHAPASANDLLPVIFHNNISYLSADHAVNTFSHEFAVYSTVIRNS